MSLSSGSSSSSGDGRGVGSEQQPQGYFAYRHPGHGGETEMMNYLPITLDDHKRGGGGKKMGSVSVQNGAVNLHIPCAFSYAYDVPVPPQKAGSKPSRIRNSIQNTCSSSRVSKSRSVPTNLSQSQPFCATVKTGELYTAKNLPPSSCSSRTQNKCSVVWDFNPDQSVPFQAVGYGQELYEEAARNLARTLQEQKVAERKSSTMSEVEDHCHDFSKPGINSSKNTARALEKAIESLKNLPEEVEGLLRKDKRFEPVVLGKATRTLNVSRNGKVFKDLIPVDPNPDVRTETENMIHAEIKRSIEAARPPSRSKDPEPKLEDFQSNSYTRIRPPPVQPPPKPSAGISIAENHDFDTVESEKRLEDESHRLGSS